MNNVLITGVSGYIGMKIASALADHPSGVAMVGIDVKPPRSRPAGLIFKERDVRGNIIDIMEEYRIDTVIHTAYVLPPIHDKALMEDINVSGTRNILAACEKARVKHLLYTSSTTAYGFYPDNPVPLTEDSPLRGNDDFTYAKNKKEIEFILQEFTNNHPEMLVTVLRPCFVVGPGFNNPLARYLQKPLVMLPRDTAPFQFVHEDDLLQVIMLCLEKSIPGIFNVAGDGTMTFPEMVTLLGNRVLHLPLWLMVPLNTLFWNLRFRFLTEFPSPGLNLVLYPWLASSRKLTETTGFRFQYNTRSAFLDFVRAVR
ncbi:MAG: SDR family oxidoreductase [Thermodesulfobacteriota bacterium]